MTTTSEAATRTSVLGGHSRRRGLFGPLSMPQLLVLAAAGAVAVIVLVLTQSLVVLLGELGLAAVLRWLWRRRGHDDQPWIQTVIESVRAKVATRTGADRYDPPAQESPRPLPREMGRVRFATASESEDAPGLAVIDHLDEDALSTVIEIVGGGDGLRDIREINRSGLAFGQFLYSLAGPELPVTQIDVTTRVMPAAPGLYQHWVQQHLDPAAPAALAQNLRELAELAAGRGDTYRSWITLRCSRQQLAQQLHRQGSQPNPERIAEQALQVTSEVARRAADAGFEVRSGLGPRRLGALVRHLYAPDWDLDDLAGITSPRDGFQPYTARGLREGMCVPGREATWWHATASIPRDGWPLHPVGMRWLESLVTDVQTRADPDDPTREPTVRTVNVQFQLSSQRAARENAAYAHTLDRAEVEQAQHSNRVSTGLNEAQAQASARLLEDLVEHAAGCRPAVRVTVSAPSAPALAEARQRVHSAAVDAGNVQRLSWHEHRHHHAHLLTLPVGKGLDRKGIR